MTERRERATIAAWIAEQDAVLQVPDPDLAEYLLVTGRIDGDVLAPVEITREKW